MINARTPQRTFRLTICLLLCAVTSAKVLNVPQQYPSIQSAVLKANPGDTVLVSPGRYVENIVITKNILVGSMFILSRDTSFISKTIIDGSRPKDPANASVVTINGETDTTCIVTGFTITGGKGTRMYLPDELEGYRYWIVGGGIRIPGSSARIAYNFIKENHLTPFQQWDLTTGAGLVSGNPLNHSSSPKLIIEHNSFINNSASGRVSEGGAMTVMVPAVIRNNTIIGNRLVGKRRAHGGAIALSDAFAVTVESNFIKQNSAGIGGAIFVGDAPVSKRSTLHIFNNILTGNSAEERGGGIYLRPGTTSFIYNNTIVENTARSSGGGVDLMRATINIYNNIVWQNTPEQIASSGTVRATNNLIQNGYPGINNIDTDPLFQMNDTLYRLMPESPCIGFMLDTMWIFRSPFLPPAADILGNKRSFSVQHHGDIGAVESSLNVSDASHTLRESHHAQRDQEVKLTIELKQVAPKIFDADSTHILRGGAIVRTVLLNDAIPYAEDSVRTPDPIVLPAGSNFLEVEFIIKNRSGRGGLLTNYKLEGYEHQYNEIFPSGNRYYKFYSNLKPGEYSLIMEPADEDFYVEHLNMSAIRILVLPYWYQRWWAYLLYAVGIIAIALGFYRARLTKMNLENRIYTEHLQAEKLNELNQIKSKFFANISHELRTPLTMIIGPIDAMAAQAVLPEQIEQLGFVQRNARKLLRLIEQLLQFTRLEAGSIKLRVAHQDIVPFLRRITGYYSSQAVKRQIDLRFAAREESITGYFDAEKIEHILENGITNSLKFTPPGGKITVQLERDVNDLLCTIIDTGEGISSEHLPHIFDRFYKADPTHKKEGTGIGLSLARDLTEIHHGTLRLESEFGKGTKFILRIPLSGYAEKEIMSVPYTESEKTLRHVPELQKTESQTEGADERPVILIAEDNDDARSFIKSQLMPSYMVIEAVDGLDALNITKFQIPDLVISDVMMPKLDGRELCRDLKQDERTCHIPVILLTALADKEDKLRGLDTGADDYLIKPFDARELVSRVQNLLAIRKKLREAFSKGVLLRPGEIPAVSMDDLFIQKAIAVVSEHMGNADFGVEIFAQEIFMSRTQLQRKLKAITNFTPNEFIRHLRLQRAKELLEKNTGSIAEIADQVGFTNHSYFSKSFQEEFGILPNQVRQSQR